MPDPDLDLQLDGRIEPGTVAVLQRLARWDVSSIDSIRTSYGAVAAAPVPADPRVRRSDEVIPGLDGRPDVKVRWYRPVEFEGDLPTLVYFHGGAYIMGSLQENDDRFDLMVIELGCAVVSIDWRLAPEHPYPAGLDDGETVWRRITENPGAFPVDPDRLVIGGGSAGAGVAAGLCLRLRERGLGQPVLQLLVYPMLDDREVTRSIRAAATPRHWGLWHLAANRLCWAAYLGPLSGGDVPATAAPARATVGELTGLAPAFLSVGDADAFLDEVVEYGMSLSRAGVPTELHVYPGVIHGGFLARPQTPRTRQLLRDVYGALALAFT